VLEIIEVDDSGRTLRLRGELDMVTSGTLAERLGPVCRTPGDVVLLIEEVTFVDSQGVRAFLQAAKDIPEGRLVLRRPTAEVRKLLEIVRIEDFPNIVMDER
jgi:anti-anti-sigma factor